MINEYALISERGIDLYENQPVESTFHPLLHTNSLLRRECLPIYFGRNEFTYGVQGCDITQYLSLLDLLKAAGYKHEPNHIRFIMIAPTRWDNLMTWCRAILDGRCEGAVEPWEDDSEEDVVVATCHDLVRSVKARNGTWAEVEVLLRNFRKMAGMIEDAWLVDDWSSIYG